MRNAGVTKTDKTAITATDVDGKTSASPLKIEGTANFFKAADTDGVSNLTRFKLTANYTDSSQASQSEDLALNTDNEYITEDGDEYQEGNTYQIINKSASYSKLYWGADGDADKLIFEIPIELPEQVKVENTDYKIESFEVLVPYSNEDYLERRPIIEQLDENKKSKGIKYTLNGGNQTAEVTSADNASIEANTIIPDYVKDTNGVIYAVTSIGENAFYDCLALGSITIPDSVTSIGDYAFWNCSNLGSVEIPDSVTSIGDSAFYGCSSLASVTIGTGVTSIGGYAFYSCSSLTSITIKSEKLNSVNWNTFGNLPSTGTIYIPDSKIKDDEYKALFTSKGLPSTWTFKKLSEKPAE